MKHITCQHRLLAINHLYKPEAGIQAFAGVVEEGEAQEKAVLRKSYEREQTSQGDHKGRPYNGRTGLPRCIIVRATLVVALTYGLAHVRPACSRPALPVAPHPQHRLLFQ